jgi:hypothetical protein
MDLRECFESLVDADVATWRSRIDAMALPGDVRDRLMVMLMYTRLVDAPHELRVAQMIACGASDAQRASVDAAIRASQAGEGVLATPVTTLLQRLG